MKVVQFLRNPRRSSRSGRAGVPGGAGKWAPRFIDISRARTADGPCKVVHLRGSVDLEHSPEIRRSLLAAVAGGESVLVDLCEVSYIDSSGIACLIEALQTARSHGKDLSLVSAGTQAMRVLELARLDTVFANHEDLAGAGVLRPSTADTPCGSGNAVRTAVMASWAGVQRSMTASPAMAALA